VSYIYPYLTSRRRTGGGDGGEGSERERERERLYAILYKGAIYDGVAVVWLRCCVVLLCLYLWGRHTSLGVFNVVTPFSCGVAFCIYCGIWGAGG